MLGEHTDGWAEKVRVKLEETSKTVANFSHSMRSAMAGLEGHLHSASADQLAHLEDHANALQK